MTSSAGFSKITLDIAPNLFSELLSATNLESVAKGRLGNHLVKMDDDGMPIVRTTTKYNIPAQNFAAIHHALVKRINDTISDNNLAGIPTQHFNNALVEVYDATYTKMNYHSDQSLDLDNDSYIGLFSCYEKPDELSGQQIRKLKIRDKVGEEEFECALTHNSVVLFSLATNTKFLHKIVLDVPQNSKTQLPGNRWLGITFRTSKTYIQFKDSVPYFANGERLELADKEQETAFYKLRGEENRSLNFVYPELTYTVNVADTIMPEGR